MEHWVTVSWAHDKSFDEMRSILEENGINAMHRHMSGDLRGFFNANGLATDKPAVFRNGSYIGSIPELKNYFLFLVASQHNGV